MPLVLSLKMDHDFYVGAEHFDVVGHEHLVSFRLRRESDGKEFVITEQSASEVMPEVFISAGGFQTGGLLRAVIDAPQSIKITRGELQRAQRSA